jgi:hypothetical protein
MRLKRFEFGRGQVSPYRAYETEVGRLCVSIKSGGGLLIRVAGGVGYWQSKLEIVSLGFDLSVVRECIKEVSK